VTAGEQLLKQGEEKGRREGRLEGRLDGERRMFLLVIRKRFGEIPPAVETRVAQAQQAELEAWTDRLNASSLDEVFADPDAAD